MFKNAFTSIIAGFALFGMNMDSNADGISLQYVKIDPDSVIAPTSKLSNYKPKEQVNYAEASKKFYIGRR